LVVCGSLADAFLPWLFGPLSGRCFAVESVLAHFLADALSPWSLSSLADALPSWSLDSLADALPSWSLGSLVDALPPLLLDARSHGWSFAQETIALLF
jgi:hypothetical protein